MHRSVQKLFSAIRLYKFGIFPLLLNRLFPRVFRYKTIIFYNVDLRDEISLSPLTVSGLSIEKIYSTRNGRFRKLLHNVSRDAFEDRISQSTKDCYLASYDREVAGYAWITCEEFIIDELNYVYPLEEDEFFIYDCFVFPEYRGRGIYPAMLRAILLDYAGGDQYRRACIGVSSSNAGSKRGVAKAGFKEYKRIKYLRWFNREKWWDVEWPVATTAGRSVGNV